MNIQTENLQSGLRQTNSKQVTYEHVIDKWDDRYLQITQTKVDITYTQDHQIIYQKDGVILRIEQIYDPKNLTIFNNMDQIEYLFWQGQYGLSNKKAGKWIAIWFGEVMINIGGYENGLKHGLWKELMKNFQIYAQVFEFGEYHNDLRIGKWNVIYRDKKIGYGYYNQKGQKVGKWIELEDSFFQHAQVKYFGEYDINSMKIGPWDIMHCKNFENNYKQIGCGSYIRQQDGTSEKVGVWREQWEGFNDDSQVIFNGKYNNKGKKIGQWDIMYCQKHKKQYRNIGGGVYMEQEDGNSWKIGSWVELWEGFKTIAQLFYIGDYNIMGQKVAKWNIVHTHEYLDNNTIQMQKISGGGKYEDQQDGTSVKVGKWIELWKGFNDDALVTQTGEYNIKGMKKGQWNILHMEKFDDDIYKQMQKQKRYASGGGQYDEQQDGTFEKVGMWIELWDGFNDDSQVIYNGEYNSMGMKIGQWDIMYRKNKQKPFKKIGGGKYDQKGNDYSIKIGEWIEMGDYWWQIYNGVYDEQGIKIGIWEEIDINQSNKCDEIRYID